MSENEVATNMKEVKRKLQKEMIKGILDYVRKGTFPNNSPNSYMNAYTIIQEMSDKGDNYNEELFNFYNSIIQDYIEECFKKIKKKSNIQLIDSFIKCTENINFLIYWMNRIFTYLDRFYTKAKNKDSLYKNAINLYKFHFFEPIQKEIFIRSCRFTTKNISIIFTSFSYHGKIIFFW